MFLSHFLWITKFISVMTSLLVVPSSQPIGLVIMPMNGKEQWRSWSFPKPHPQYTVAFATSLEIIVVTLDSSLYSGLGSVNRIFPVEGWGWEPRFFYLFTNHLQFLKFWHRAEKHPSSTRYSEKIKMWSQRLLPTSIYFSSLTQIAEVLGGNLPHACTCGWMNMWKCFYHAFCVVIAMRNRIQIC